MGTSVYDRCSAGFGISKIFQIAFSVGRINMHKKLASGEFRVSGAIPSRPSGLNWVQSQRKNRALTPISLVYCGKSAAAFNRRLFSAELEGLHEDRSAVCLCGGETQGPVSAGVCHAP